MKGKCEFCGCKYQIDDMSWLGKEAECPSCHKTIVIADEEKSGKDAPSAEIGRQMDEGPGEGQNDLTSIYDITENKDDAVFFVKQTLSDTPVEDNRHVIFVNLSNALFMSGCMIWFMAGASAFYLNDKMKLDILCALSNVLAWSFVLASFLAGVQAFFFSRSGIRFKLQPNEVELKTLSGLIYTPKKTKDDTEGFAESFIHGRKKYCTIRLTNRRIAIGTMEMPVAFSILGLVQVPIKEIMGRFLHSSNVDIELVKGEVLDMQKVEPSILYYDFGGPLFLHIGYGYLYLNTRNGRFVLKASKKHLSEWFDRKDNIIMQGDSVTEL